MIHAIPTMYKAQRFRSRLEARWASFFDELRWPWEYEPIDLDGYVPDFVLRFDAPLLVEVKPAFSLRELAEHTSKIEESGWSGEALLVGACLFEGPVWQGAASLGLLADRCDESRWGWDASVFQTCGKCGKRSLYHSSASWHCRVSGCHQGDDYIGPIAFEDAQAIWRKASNAVQWRAG